MFQIEKSQIAGVAVHQSSDSGPAMGTNNEVAFEVPLGATIAWIKTRIMNCQDGSRKLAPRPTHPGMRMPMVKACP